MSRCRTALQLMPVSDAVSTLLHTRQASCPRIFMSSQFLLIADARVLDSRLCTTCALIFLSSMTACPCQMLKNCQGHVLNSLSSRKLGMGKTRAALALNSQQLAEIAGTFDACSFQKRAGSSHWKLALNICVALNELLC